MAIVAVDEFKTGKELSKVFGLKSLKDVQKYYNKLHKKNNGGIKDE